MFFNAKVLEFKVMDTTNIYEFLHLLVLIKIKPNMDFEGNLAFAHLCHETHSYFSISFKGKWRN